jgi:hypothetical protein
VKRLIHPLDSGERPAKSTLGVFVRLCVLNLELADACKAPNMTLSLRAFPGALYKAVEGVNGGAAPTTASYGRCRGFPALFRLSRSNTMVSILKKRQRGQIMIDYHVVGLFPISTMVSAKKIEDIVPHRNLRASAVFSPKRQGFATLLQWAVRLLCYRVF